MANLNSHFNIGIDKSISVVDDTGAAVNLGKIKDVTGKPIANTTTIKPINTNGLYKNRRHYNGVEGSISIYREDGRLDQIQYINEQLYQNGGQQKYYTIHEVVENEDGTIDEFTWLNCLLWLDDYGTWQEDDSVVIKVSFIGEQRNKVS